MEWKHPRVDDVRPTKWPGDTPATIIFDEPAEFTMSPEAEAKIAAWVKDAAGDLPDGEFEDTGSLMSFCIPGWDLR